MVGPRASRAKAFFSHLGIGFVIFLVLLYVLLRHWYPGVFFHTNGGSDALLILSVCTMAIGPFSTLLIFKPGKNEFRVDVLVITITYLILLAASVWFVYLQRPLALVFSNNQFYSLTAESFTRAGQKVPNFNDLPGSMPKRIFSSTPESSQSKEYRIEPTYLNASLYKPLAQNWSRVIARAGLSISEVIDGRSHGKAEIALWLHRHGKTSEEIVLVPVAAASSRRYFYVDRSAPSILGVTSDMID